MLMIRLTQIRHTLQLRYKPILIFLAILLFRLNYQLCESIYSNDIYKWWVLRTNIYAILFGLWAYIAKLETRKENKNIVKALFIIASGLTISDIIDRLFFDMNKYQKDDLYMEVITYTIAIVSFYKDRILNSKLVLSLKEKMKLKLIKICGLLYSLIK